MPAYIDVRDAQEYLGTLVAKYERAGQACAEQAKRQRAMGGMESAARWHSRAAIYLAVVADLKQGLFDVEGLISSRHPR